jgi:hypothetical protein
MWENQASLTVAQIPQNSMLVKRQQEHNTLHKRINNRQSKMQDAVQAGDETG